MTGVFRRSLLRPNCHVEARYYKTDGKRYNFISYGNLGAQGTITKTKYIREAYQIGDLPKSSYAPAKLHLTDIEKGIVKYFNPVKHWDDEDIFTDLWRTFSLPVSPYELQARVFKEFDSYFPGLSTFLDTKLPFETVLKYMTHDISGNLRKKTSAGLGFEHDRKYIARNFPEDVRSVYELETFDFDVYWKVFLKDELRDTAKSTRSIAVPQLHLWIIAMTHLGGIYEWFSHFLPPWCGYGLDDRCVSWHAKLRHFDPELKTYGYDIRQQDSKMSPGFICFISIWLKSKLPISSWNALEWYLDQTFFEKKLVDAKGNILEFAPGEPSGNPLTIIFNIMDTLFKQVSHAVIADILNLHKNDKEVFIIMGDDVLKQTETPDLYRQVVEVIGNELTKEEGALLHDVTFLSQKITMYKGQYAPYYANMDKMYASLRYTTKGDDEYFCKLCSFYNMLIYAPEGSIELEWKKRIEAHIYYFMGCGLVRPALYACFKPSHLQKRDRSGMVYHSSTPWDGGRVEIIDLIFNMTKSSLKKFKKKNNLNLRSESKQKLALPAKHSHKPSKQRMQKAKTSSVLSVLPPGMSKNEKAIVKEYVTQLLWPTRPIKLVRPIPVRSFPYFKSGEITFTSSVKYTEVQFRPHPWRFIELKTQSPVQTVSFADHDYTTNPGLLLPLSENEQFSAGTTHAMCMVNNFHTTDGKELQIVFKRTPSLSNLIAIYNDVPVSQAVMGWPGVTCQGTLTGTISNASTRTVTAYLDVYIVNSDGSVATAIPGTGVGLNGDSSINVNSASLVGVVCAPDQLFCIAFRILNGAAGNVFIKDFIFSLESATAPILATSVASSRVYTFGEALYPTSPELANTVMEAFSGSNLWSPVAMACLYNVSQELAQAGGKFAASYLPSFISEEIPEDFADAWSFLNTIKASYPHYEGDLITGAHGSWLGARIDDYSFVKPFARDHVLDYEALSLPSDVFMSNVVSETPNFQYYISFAAAFEIQTISPNFTCTLGPSSVILMPQMLAMMAASDALVGENPSHLKRIADIVRKIVADPTVQQGFKTLAGAGLAALLL